MDWFEKSINIEEEGGKTAVEAANDLVGFATGIVMVIGVFIIVGGTLMYIRAIGEDNARDRSNASITLGVGIFFIVIPQVINQLFG